MNPVLCHSAKNREAKKRNRVNAKDMFAKTIKHKCKKKLKNQENTILSERQLTMHLKSKCSARTAFLVENEVILYTTETY